jgi:predicted Zn-dependent protease
MSLVESRTGLVRSKREARPGQDATRYSLRFALTALILIAATLVLVLVVLPERYVLRPGFRESGMSFPDPTTPFATLPVTSVAARPLPPPPVIPLPGPSEALWDDVIPLIDAGDYAAALPLLDRYLLDYPDDLDVRRERVAALTAAGREDAISELRRLVASTDDPADRLALARMLRDLHRTDEAEAEYARLAATRPDDVTMAVERAQAFAWVGRYADAAAVLEAALARAPASALLRVELARVYYESGRLAQARALLGPLDERTLADASGTELRDAVEAALYVPPPPPPIPPTLLEQAVAAREADDFVRARALLQQAVGESPGDATLWQAYADLLEYEVGDLEGALAALLEVERLSSGAGSPDANLQYRLAQLEIWTGRTDGAEARLLSLLAHLDAGGATGTVSSADVQAALGDLRRWRGDRLGAADRYARALASDPGNARARAGRSALEAEVEQTVLEVERPRMGGIAYSLADTDDFGRVDVGGEWVETSGRWAWGGTAGSRWISGLGLESSPARRNGAFVELKGARWWRWGTVRTGFDMGAERLAGEWKLAAAASLSHRGSGVTELRVDHAPAYPAALTLASALAGLDQQRVALTHVRALGSSSPTGEDGRWRGAVLLEAARIVADAVHVAPASPRSTHRLRGSLDLGRGLTPSITLGAIVSGVHVTRAAPRAPLPAGGTARLFWDPELVVAAAPYAQLVVDLTSSLRATARIAPGVALIQERGATGSEVVPHLAGEAGLRRDAGRLSAALDLFYSQGQFDGYRAYGARLSLSAAGFGGSAVRP